MVCESEYFFFFFGFVKLYVKDISATIITIIIDLLRVIRHTHI